MGLADGIRERWSAAPEAVPITLLDDSGPRPLSGGHLADLAARHAAALAAIGVGPGDRVGLVLPTGEDFLGAFFGAWSLGAAAVPLAPPNPRQDPAGEAERLERALATAQVRLTVVAPDAAALLASCSLPLLDARSAGSGRPERSSRARPTREPAGLARGPVSHERVAPALDLAVIQFSSGSTRAPRGVALSEANLLANVEAIATVLQVRPGDVGVAWLPLHHDMGLIGCLLFTQYAGIPLVLLPPECFIREPVRYVRALSAYRATLTSAPTFGYRLCASLPEVQTADCDLSALRAALIGAEPVRPAVLDAFASRYARNGFDASAFVPTYGLAEATLAVAMTPPGRGLRREGHLAGAGPPVPGVEVSIHDEASGDELPERQVGEIRVRGACVAAGYFGDPGATAASFGPDGLRTGDLGYLADGELFIAGRIKDLIIKGGRKYHPQDLEAIAETHVAVRSGGAFAFLAPRADGREDRLVLVAEVHTRAASPEIGTAIRREVLDRAGVRLDEVLLVVPQQLPRTTSGKPRRYAARERYLADAFVRADG